METLKAVTAARRCRVVDALPARCRAMSKTCLQHDAGPNEVRMRRERNNPRSLISAPGFLCQIPNSTTCDTLPHKAKRADDGRQ